LALLLGRDRLVRNLTEHDFFGSNPQPEDCITIIATITDFVPNDRSTPRVDLNVASVRSVVAGGGNLQYDTSKAAVAGLTRALAADHSAEGIRVNAVGPGPIFTPFHQRRIAAAGETIEQYNARAAQGTMLKRPGRAEEVAAAILFLASDDAFPRHFERP
jgi:NAD(P)-dependent dehydrogenase (short-subunit alcohol dehydrogenase family)